MGSLLKSDYEFRMSDAARAKTEYLGKLWNVSPIRDISRRYSFLYNSFNSEHCRPNTCFFSHCDVWCWYAMIIKYY